MVPVEVTTEVLRTDDIVGGGMKIQEGSQNGPFMGRRGSIRGD